MANICTNLSERQIDAIDHILNRDKHELWCLEIVIDGRTFDALLRHGILERPNRDYILTAYGIQSYCATILTKYDGATHERIHSALNNYQRLFN